MSKLLLVAALLGATPALAADYSRVWDGADGSPPRQSPSKDAPKPPAPPCDCGAKR